MAKFRKKPVEIEAHQWLGFSGNLDVDGKRITDLFAWMEGKSARDRAISISGGTVLIQTLEGTMTADDGDWIICGIQGELYPCKPDIFSATYDPCDT